MRHHVALPCHFQVYVKALTFMQRLALQDYILDKMIAFGECPFHLFRCIDMDVKMESVPEVSQHTPSFVDLLLVIRYPILDNHQVYVAVRPCVAASARAVEYDGFCAVAVAQASCHCGDCGGGVPCAGNVHKRKVLLLLCAAVFLLPHADSIRQLLHPR